MCLVLDAISEKIRMLVFLLHLVYESNKNVFMLWIIRLMTFHRNKQGVDYWFQILLLSRLVSTMVLKVLLILLSILPFYIHADKICKFQPPLLAFRRECNVPYKSVSGRIISCHRNEECRFTEQEAMCCLRRRLSCQSYCQEKFPVYVGKV